VTDLAGTNVDELARLGRWLRALSIRMADEAGSGHPTSSMSAADLIAVLVADHLTIDLTTPEALGNDHLIFSKGHASPLLYAALNTLGLISDDQLRTYRQHGSPLEGHPTPRVPGVEVATGSLGLGLPFGVGLALAARDLDHTDARTWVLCGDSEMAEGSVWEAIEHAGWTELSNLTAIVDVNRLGQTGPTRHGWDVAAYQRRFAAAGWHTSVIDGHDPGAIGDAYREARRASKPSVVIARTHKGSGASETDDEAGKHGKPLDDPDAAIDELGEAEPMHIRPLTPRLVPTPTHTPAPGGPELPMWEVGDEVATRDAFGQAAVAIGRWRDDVVALDAEVGDSTRLEAFREAFADRFFQMYIAEQLMCSVATGMQVTGWRPILATFGAFLTRAHDVLRMAAISRATLCIAGSHAGVSIGPDGPSQMGLEDLAMMRSLHGSTVLSPCDANQTAGLLPQLLEQSGIGYLRTARGASPVIYQPTDMFEIGGSTVVRSSSDDAVTIIAAGMTVHEAVAAADELASRGAAARVIDAYSVKPIDEVTLRRAAAETGRLVVVEDHRPEGGLGEAVLSAVTGAGLALTVRHLAVRNMPASATPAEQRRDAGIDAAAIVEATDDLIGRER
jgi:transketolase